MLTQLKLHLKMNRVVSLYDLMHRFNVDPDLLRNMLQLWINKGKVRQCAKTNRCGVQCSKCHPLMTETYEWIETVGDYR